MKVLFLPFRETWETEEQRKTLQFSASSRLRADWIAKYWNGADVLDKMPAVGMPDDAFPSSNYDVFIFQKAFTPRFIQFARWLKEHNKKVIFDLSDADWVYPQRKELIEQMIQIADTITASTFYIQNYISKTYRKPVDLVLDRLDLDEFPKVKEHENSKDPKVVWFGNRNTIGYVNLMEDILVEAYQKTPFKLIVISDQFENFRFMQNIIPVEKVLWRIDTFDQEILKGDVVINPHDLTNDIGKAKSDNKTIHSWALGMPVVSHGNNHRQASLLSLYLENAMLRNEVGRIGRNMVEKFYDVRISVLELQKITQNLLGRG